MANPIESMHLLQASTVALPIFTLRVEVFSAPHNSQAPILSPLTVQRFPQFNPTIDYFPAKSLSTLNNGGQTEES